MPSITSVDLIITVIMLVIVFGVGGPAAWQIFGPDIQPKIKALVDSLQPARRDHRSFIRWLDLEHLDAAQAIEVLAHIRDVNGDPLFTFTTALALIQSRYEHVDRGKLLESWHQTMKTPKPRPKPKPEIKTEIMTTK